MDDKKKRWEEANKNCLSKAVAGDFWAQEDGKEAIRLAREIFGESSIELADSNKNMAIAYLYQNYPDSALKFSQVALDIAKKQTDKYPDKVATIIHQHATVLHNLKDFQNAEKYYKEALDIRESHEEGGNIIAKSLGDIARLYYDTGREEEAYKVQQQVSSTLEKYIAQSSNKNSDEYVEAVYDHAINLSNIAIIKREKEQYSEAAKIYQQIIPELEEVKKLGGQVQPSLANNIRANLEALKGSWQDNKYELDTLLSQLNKVQPPEEKSD